MSINWDNKKRKTFRLALQQVYPSKEELEIFVYEELNQNITEIASDKSLTVMTSGLIAWACAKGKINELFQAFSEENPYHPIINDLQGNTLIQKQVQITEEQWDTLFQYFDNKDDLLGLKIAFKSAMKGVLIAEFQGLELLNVALDSIDIIRAQLERFDNPKLTVQFVNKAIQAVTCFSENLTRDVLPLERWRDNLARQYSITVDVVNADDDTSDLPTKAAYLMVSVKEVGRVSQGIEDVILYPELHVVVDQSEPIEFNLGATQCSLQDIGKYLSKFVYEAEDKCISDECDDVILELFLSWQRLEENIGVSWKMEDRHGNEQELQDRSFVVRSLDRFLDSDVNPTLMTQLQKKWNRLNEGIQKRSPYKHFCIKEGWPKSGKLTALLKQKVGLKLIGDLPSDSAERRALLHNIIDAAIPIALWTKNDSCPPAEFFAELDKMLQGACLTDFASVANSLLEGRVSLSSEAVSELRMLLDCPDRWPVSLPKNTPETEETEDEDSLIAAP